MANGLSHVRIDEGVKRGPRRKPAIRARDDKGRNLPTIPVGLDPQAVLERYLADERTADIAQSLGVSRSGLNQWLLRNAEEDWRAAQVARAVTALERSKDDLDGAADPLSLARAREQLRAAQWDLERLYSRMYGQKQEVTVSVVSVEERLVDDLRCLLPTQSQPKLLNNLESVITSNSPDVVDVQHIPAPGEGVASLAPTPQAPVEKGSPPPCPESGSAQNFSGTNEAS